MRPLIVIPTYNERRNLSVLAPVVLKTVLRASLLVVDDASPDGTAGLVRSLARRHRGRVHLLSRPAKLGLGTAYVAGFRWAIDHGYDPIIQMDADGSHDPAALPGLRSADAVVGSRYLAGLRVINWPWLRLLLSLLANRYARLVTGVPLTDLTGGFNGWRAHILRRIGLGRIRCNGYAFQIELKLRCRRAGGRIAEVPIVFTGRVEGESKLSRSVVFEAVWAVWRMRLGGV
jgi:dolichol-phosphate mannosyltransferase